MDSGMNPHEKFRTNLADLRNIVENFRIVGAAGSFQRGYQIREGEGAAAEGGGVSGPPILPPPTPTGACCDDEGNCTIQTETHCNSLGRDYQGDSVPCSPNPCPPPPPPTGACCREEVCTIETQESCEADGGLYQGDGTPCEPNPCELPVCSCGFAAFDGSGRRFLTRTWTANHSEHWEDDDEVCGSTHCDLTASSTRTDAFNLETCESTTNCTGSYTFDAVVYDGVPVPIHDEGEWCLNNEVSGCGICAGSCPTSASGLGCGSSGCSCSATSLSCSSSDSTENECNCAGGRPTTVTGNCSFSLTVTLSNECIPTIALEALLGHRVFDELFE